MRTLGIILQARTESSRLPRKVLMDLCGKPLIQWVIDGLARCRPEGMLVLATSDLPSDDVLADVARNLGIPVFRGSGPDVLDRYYRCARDFGMEHIVRATGDNPIVDPEVYTDIVTCYRQRAVDYVTVEQEGYTGYPKGVWLEAFSLEALTRSWREGWATHHREHVNEYILENRRLFSQVTLAAPPSKRGADVRLTVDTQDDLQRMREVFASYFSHADHEPSVPVPWAIARSRNHTLD